MSNLNDLWWSHIFLVKTTQEYLHIPLCYGIELMSMGHITQKITSPTNSHHLDLNNSARVKESLFTEEEETL